MNELRAQVIDTETGEIIRTLSPGDSIITAEEKERRLKAKKKREEHTRPRKEKYLFLEAIHGLEGLRPETATKLIYLSTFADYDNRLVHSVNSKVPIKRRELQEVLKVKSRQTVYNFWNEVSPKYVTEDGDENLYLNIDIFKRGKLPPKDFTTYQQLYFQGIRNVYETAGGNNHKYLGHIFLMIPFVNREWNILCDNPFETDIDKIKKISVKEFCEKVGYTKESYQSDKNIKKISKIYDSILFNVGDTMQRFCTMDSRRATIAVNPNIFFVGSNSSRVEVLKIFFKD